MIIADTYLQSIAKPPLPSYKAPASGVITSWSFQAAATAPQQIRLKTARGGDMTLFWTIAGESAFEAPQPNQLNTFLTRVSVQAGDVIGIFATPASGLTMTSATNPNPSDPPFAIDRRDGDQPVGSTQPYGRSGNPIYRIDVSASLEPDADNDGFGDETQDGCPSDAAVQGPCPDASPPDTVITASPKDKLKTKKKRKKVSFEFTASEPVAGFECSLDGEPFAACSSPHSFKVKKGKHSFAVRATDLAGNVDASPASDAWRVKKKKKKK